MCDTHTTHSYIQYIQRNSNNTIMLCDVYTHHTLTGRGLELELFDMCS